LLTGHATKLVIPSDLLVPSAAGGSRGEHPIGSPIALNGSQGNLSSADRVNEKVKTVEYHPDPAD